MRLLLTLTIIRCALIECYLRYFRKHLDCRHSRLRRPRDGQHILPHLFSTFGLPAVLELFGSAQIKFISSFGPEWSLKRRDLGGFVYERQKPAAELCKLWRAFYIFNLPGRLWIQARMDQASGGEDPNKPSKKKSNEDEGRNKKLVGVRANLWF